MPLVRHILDRRTSIPKVLSVLRAATVPRSTEILPLGFDWVITFVAPLGRSRGLPGCAPFCVKAFSGAVSAPSHLLGRSRVSPAAPHFALSRLCEISPSTRVARGALAGDPADAGDGVPCVARHRFWALCLLRRGTSRVAVCGARVAVCATGPVGHSVRSTNGPDAQRTSPQGLAMPPLPRHKRRGGAGRTACSVKLIRLKSVWHCIVGACASRLQCCALSGLGALPRGELRKDCWECRSRRQMGTALV